MQGDQLFKMPRCIFLHQDALLLNRKIILDAFENFLLSEKKASWAETCMLLIFLSCCFLDKTASQDACWSHWGRGTAAAGRD